MFQALYLSATINYNSPNGICFKQIVKRNNWNNTHMFLFLYRKVSKLSVFEIYKFEVVIEKNTLIY